jgi:hypothetical protein
MAAAVTSAARVAGPDRDPDKTRRGMVGRRRVIIDGEEFVEVRPPKGRRTGETTFIFRLPRREAQQAAQLSKSALIVWMELQHQCHWKQVRLVTLPVAELAEWGVDRQSRYNAAKQLVAARLIHTVPQAPGKATLYGLGSAPKARKQRASRRKKSGQVTAQVLDGSLDGLAPVSWSVAHLGSGGAI